MATRLLLEGPDLEALLDRVRTEHGADARIVSADRLRKGGVAGFFSKQWFEIGVEVPDPGDPALPKEQVLSVKDLMDLADKHDGGSAAKAVPEQRVDEPASRVGDPFAKFFADAGGPPANGAPVDQLLAAEAGRGISAAAARAAGPGGRTPTGEWEGAVLPRVGDAPRGLEVAGLELRDGVEVARGSAGAGYQRPAWADPKPAPTKGFDESAMDDMTDEELRAVLLGEQAAPWRPPSANTVRPAEFPSVQRPTAGGRMFAAQSTVEAPAAPEPVAEPVVDPVVEDTAVASSIVDDVLVDDSATVDTEPVEPLEENDFPHALSELLVPPRMPSSHARHALPDEDDYLDDAVAEPISAATEVEWPTADEPRLLVDPTPRPRRRWDTPVPRDLLVALPGKVIVVAGALHEATIAAEWICQKMRLGPGAVQVAGPDQIGRGRVLGPEHAADMAYDLSRKPVPSIVAIASAVEDPEGGRWAGSVAQALGAQHIVAAIDATRKTADLRRHLADLGGVDAVAVYGTAASTDPDSVRELGLPILIIDGVPPTTPTRRGPA